jgi:YD repeat-containing protein
MWMAGSSAGPDGSEWVLRNTYGSHGLVDQTSSDKDGNVTSETLYQYDDRGRLLSIRDTRSPQNPVTFLYDATGRKTKIQSSRPEDYLTTVSYAGSPLQIADHAPNISGGGTATTVYDEKDRPIEVQVRDAKGELVSRTVRNYDEKGQVIDEKQILDDPIKLLSVDAISKDLEEHGAFVNDLREQLSKLMAGQSGAHSMAYRYDAQGRVSQTIQRFLNQEFTIDSTYNEHGDLATQVTRTREIGEHIQGSPGARYSEARYNYTYDPEGNWTEKVDSYRSSPDSEFKTSTTTIRTLTYF